MGLWGFGPGLDNKISTIVRCNPSSTGTPSSSEEEDRIREETYFDWCEEEGCSTGASSPFILRQKVSPSRRRQAIVDGCADLRLTGLNKLKFTLVDCNDKRKPLCMRGEPIINNEVKRLKKKRFQSKQRKKDLRKKQTIAKFQWRKMLMLRT